ncbi:secreted protein [Streptomyces zinciresistens K42]|uniref:Secreted protein n=2 Tax=Streptomyces TaxID=1883 RepID=G2GL06_9ACTN|nr:secreted protein [Streptomyces zinciresistens K42]
MIAIAAASGAMAVAMPAYADSAADGAATDSPGVLSGNTLQVPVHVPVNVCGNTVNVVGLLNPAVGNKCANVDGGGKKAAASDGAKAEGVAKDSPGIGSGNAVQLPVHVPVNVTGNSVNVIGVGNAAIDNESVNGPADTPAKATPEEKPKPSVTPRAHKPRPAPAEPAPVAYAPEATLAQTGADPAVPTAVGAAALVAGGALLYRRFRPTGTR